MGSCYVMRCLVSSLGLYSSRCGRDIAGCGSVIVLWLSYGCLCSVSFPHSAVDWSSACADPEVGTMGLDPSCKITKI